MSNEELCETERRFESGKREEVTQMKTYRIMNKLTHEFWQGNTENVKEAIERTMWPEEECLITERTDKGGWKKPKDK